MAVLRHGVLADSGPLIAAIDPDDQFHQQARSELEHIRSMRMRVAVTTATVFEAYSLVLRHLGVSSALRWLDDVRNNSTIIYAQPKDIADAYVLVHRFRDQDISLFDALAHITAKRTGLPIWSYDHHFDVLRATRWYADA